MRARITTAMLAAVMALGAMGVGSAVAAPAGDYDVAAKRFPNCTALNKRYPQGVGKPKAVNKVSGRRTSDRNHKKSLPLYRANSHLDRDKDGVACER